MQVLLKTDGLPTYHLANVVDDHLMQISHVIRGEEWLSSAPKHQLLYRYFGWQMPVLCHMPLLRNPDKSKLSKRKNPTSITYYRDMGYLPEALLNYLGRMGWSMPSEQEQFTLGQMIEAFDINRVSLGGPIFDVEKLNWLNGQWIKQLQPAQLLANILAWASQGGQHKLTDIARAIQPRISTYSDAIAWAGFYFNGLPPLAAEMFESKKISRDQVRQNLQLALWRLEQLADWQQEAISQLLTGLCNQLGLKMRDFMPAFFVAIAGSPNSTPVMESMQLIGADLTYARLRAAIECLGGVSKKETTEWQKLDAQLWLIPTSEAAMPSASGEPLGK
jgi:glutamyl-tRNA synthetase